MISYASTLPTSDRSRLQLQAQSTARGLVRMIQLAKSQNRFTPDVVEAFAALALTDDGGLPIMPAPHHRLWLQLACDPRIKKLLILAPPESAKTTWIVSAYLTASIGFRYGLDHILASVSNDVATKRSLAVRTLTASPVWRAIFPDLQPVYSKWEQNSWTIAPGGKDKPGRIHRTLTAYGTGDSIVGSRADILIGDDILDLDNTRTQHQRELIDEWIHTSLLSRVKARVGRVILIGTSWNAADAYAKIRREDAGWVICHTPSVSESEDGFHAFITYPDGWKFERLGEPIGGQICQ